MMLQQCMILCPWEGKFYFLIFVWEYFLISSFLHFCCWFCLNSWDTKGASAKKFSVAGRLHSGNFVEWYLVHQSRHESRCSLDSVGLFLQLIEKDPNLCNLLYPPDIKDTFWPINISVSDCHFKPVEWTVVLGWIPVLFWN